MGKDVIWGMLSDVHFIVIEGMNGEVIGGMLCMINGLVEMGG
jgi:hypothetical protein